MKDKTTKWRKPAKEEKKLCPFKKTTDLEYNGYNSKKTVHERFEVCAGERCMAYSKGKCLRLKTAEQKPTERWR